MNQSARWVIFLDDVDFFTVIFHEVPYIKPPLNRNSPLTYPGSIFFRLFSEHKKRKRRTRKT